MDLTSEDIPSAPGTLVGHGTEERLRARCPHCGREDSYIKPLMVPEPEGSELLTPVFSCTGCDRVFGIDMPPEAYQHE